LQTFRSSLYNHDKTCHFKVLVPVSTRESDENGHPRPVSPYKAADPDLTAVVARCHDLRPTNFSRAGVDRDDVWVKTQFLSLRTWIYGILADFNRSGEQQGKSEADLEWISKDHQERWVYHCSAKSRRYPGVTSYACGILGRGSLESLGRDCGKGGRDSSLNGKSYGSAKTAEQERDLNPSAKSLKTPLSFSGSPNFSKSSSAAIVGQITPR
jgi:hypothetical protein